MEFKALNYVREIIRSKKNGIIGKHNDISKDTFDEKELKRGVDIEFEHTNDKSVAEAIAKDHLSEFPDYYTRLDEMEQQAKREYKNKEN